MMGPMNRAGVIAALRNRREELDEEEMWRKGSVSTGVGAAWNAFRNREEELDEEELLKKMVMPKMAFGWNNPFKIKDFINEEDLRNSIGGYEEELREKDLPRRDLLNRIIRCDRGRGPRGTVEDLVRSRLRHVINQELEDLY